MRVGVLKPDHLGDLILAAPALAALQRRFEHLTLFCHPNNVALAGHLFPGIRRLALHLPHLDKERAPDSRADVCFGKRSICSSACVGTVSVSGF